MRRLPRSAFGLILMLGLVPEGAVGQQTAIFINGQPLAVEVAAGADLPPGRYWYDPVSGLWGVEGGPSVGQIEPGLPLGGPLAPDASNGDTGVFINHRQIHVTELLDLQRMLGEVPPGRYWLDADLVGGIEGQPASFDLKDADLKAAAAPPSEGSAEGGAGYFEDRVSDFCMRNACPSDLQGAVDDMNSYVPDYGTE